MIDGVSIEVFGRSPENCWREALRVDCYPKDSHVHLFPLSGKSSEASLGDLTVLPRAILVGRDFLRINCSRILGELGYSESAAEAGSERGQQTIEQTCDFAAEMIHGVSRGASSPDR